MIWKEKYIMKLDKAMRRDRKISRRNKTKVGGDSKHWDKVTEKREDIKIKRQREEKASRIGNE
jgi:hypothetical protein